VKFDHRRGEPRNADVVGIARRREDILAISIEAKADESFDRLVKDALADAVDRTAHGERSELSGRIGDLAASMLPSRAPGTPGLGDLRYQLLTAAAGTLAHAAEVGAPRAVFIVHEFITDDTDDSLRAPPPASGAD